MTAEEHKGTALVTGAGVRVGRAIAETLAADGWAVALHYRNSQGPAEEVAAAIRDAGGTAALVQADLANEAAIAGLVADAAGQLGPVTCLVNNASIFEYDDLPTVTRESWDTHMDTNLRAPLVLSQQMSAQLPDGRQGNIINIIDQRVWRLTPQFLSYTLSKAGLWTLTQTLAQYLAPRIRVNAIGPGPVLASSRQTEESFLHQARQTPLGHPVDLEDICGGVRYILSARSMTGQMIALDSGQHLAWETPDVVSGE